MRYPKFLTAGGRIGFIAPSFGCSTEPYRTAFDAALARFRKAGFTTVTGPNCYEQSGIGKSNTPAACGAEINDFFLNDRADVIISCGGGETMCEDLPYTDFGAIAEAEPHWYMGYSDNTNFTFLLTTLCDVASIYGPCAREFGMDPIHPSIVDAHDLLRGKKLTMKSYGFWEKEKPGEDAPPTAPYNATEKLVLHSYPRRNMTFSGRLIGGCMDCLVNFLGTGYDNVRHFVDRYRDDGILWFLESCDLTVWGIRRAIWQMQHAGWFEHVNGFLIGRPWAGQKDTQGTAEKFDMQRPVVRWDTKSSRKPRRQSSTVRAASRPIAQSAESAMAWAAFSRTSRSCSVPFPSWILSIRADNWLSPIRQGTHLPQLWARHIRRNASVSSTGQLPLGATSIRCCRFSYRLSTIAWDFSGVEILSRLKPLSHSYPFMIRWAS